MSKIGDKIHVDTDIYVAKCEELGCSGCAADDDYALCNEISERVRCDDIIWIKQQPVETQDTTCNQTKGEPEMNVDKTTETAAEEPKYTLAEFIEACNDWYGHEDCPDSRNAYFRQFLERKNNPEYHEYLRLKAIFG